MNPLTTRCRFRSLLAERLLISLFLLLALPIAWAGPAPVAGTSASATVTGTSPVTMHFPLTRSGDSGFPVWVNFQTQDGTAIAGTDYTAALGATTVPAAATGASIPVQILGASNYSPDKQFTLNLLSAVGVGPTATFAGQAAVVVGSLPYSVTTADLNGDGKLDVITANSGSSNISVRLNTTAPGAATTSFAALHNFTVGTKPVSVTAADVNGDGKPDLIVANANSGTVSVLINTTATGALIPSFAAQQSFTVRSQPMSVTTADVNGDGKPDLIVTNYSDDTVSVLLNTTAPGASTPSFAAQQTFAVGGGPRSVTTADLNGDGKPDLIVANLNTNAVSVLLNTTTPGASTPSFSAQTYIFPSLSNPSSVTTADVNGNGKPDLIVTGYLNQQVSVLINNTRPGSTALSFSPAHLLNVGSQPNFVTTVDLNGDGKPDLIIANTGSNSVSLFENTTAPGATTPSFAAQQTLSVGSGPFSVTAADLNGDGKPDLIAANYNWSNLTVYLNTTPAPTASAPSFATQQTFATSTGPYWVTTADLNGDGKPDLITANFYSTSVSVLLNTTAPGATIPTFATQQAFTTGGANTASVTAADLNGDGKPDLITANENNNTASVLLNTTTPGAATPSFATQKSFSVGSSPISVTTADVNGDGKPDLIVCNTSTVSVLLNTTAPGAATASFAAQQTFAISSAGLVTAADVNGDGKPDLIVTNESKDTVSVLLNQVTPGTTSLTSSSFATAQTFAVGSGPVSVAVADVNGDGKPDLIVTNNGSDTVSVLLNTTTPGSSTASFATQQTFITGSGPELVRTADVNGDGKPDLIVANYFSDTVSVLLNTTATGSSTASFAAQQTFATGNSPFAVTTADLNGDGMPDLIASNFSGNTVSVLLNTLYTATVSPASVTGTIHYAIPEAAFSPDPLAFGNILVGTSSTKAVTLTNSGQASLSISSFALGGTNAAKFSQTNNCPASLAIGASCTIQVSYAPNALSTDTATLSVSTNEPNSPDTLALSGTGSDTAPTANNGTLTTSTNTAASGTLSATDPDPGQSLTYSIVTQPAHGTVAITNAATGTYTYTPASGYAGNDSFTFKANDGYKDSNAATVSITVNDNAPTANNGTLTTNTDTSANGTLSATNPDSGQTLTYSIVTPPAHGTVTITNANTGAYTYTPASGYAGSDSFTFKANDGYLDSNTATVSITVADTPPTAIGASLSTPTDQTLSGQLQGNANDAGQTLTFALAQAPTHGSVTVNANGGFSYTPASGYVGNDSFTFVVNDGYQNSAPATVSITINDTAPTASNTSFTTPINTAYSGQLQANNPDSGQALTYSIVTQPSHGSLNANASTGAYTYTPNTGYVGSDSFTFKVNDGYKNSNTATVSASVADNPPVAQSASYNVTANSYVSGTLKATVSNSSQTLTYALVSKPAHGTVNLDAGTGQFTYIPTHNYTGTDSFTFKASDGTLDSNAATVTLKVAAGALAAHNGTGGGAFGPWGLALLAGLALLIALPRRKPSARGFSRGTKTAVLALGLVLAASVLVTATPARAADTGPWYAGIQGNVIKAASGRNSATAGFKGWTLLFGRHLGTHFALEIDRASYSDYPKTLTATANWVNWGLRGLYFPWKSQGAFAPFVYAGAGHQYEYQGDNSELSNNSASLGLGFTSQPWSAPVAIRADIEAQHGFGGGYTDKIFSLGVVFGFGGGASQALAAPPQPAAATAPPPPPPADTDGDGVPDSADQCPGTPSGVSVDAKGCPVDSDGDGVPDYLDRCPGTPTGTPVDTHGCPLQQVIRLKNVHFKTSSSVLSGSDQASLDAAATTLKRYPVLKAEVAGYTDSVGPAAYNRSLSAKRAKAVKVYLVAHGVAADRLTTRGYGETHPVASNKTAVGRTQNRRVELHIQNLDQLKGKTTVKHQ